LKFVFSVGKEEKHEVEVSKSFLLGRLVVKVDGEEKVNKIIWYIRWFPLTSPFIIPIGEREKHELIVRPRSFGRLKIYVDGKPFRMVAERVYESRGEKEWILWAVIAAIWVTVMLIALILVIYLLLTFPP